MRQQAYHLFEIAAWPAAVWCAAEVVLRGVTGARDGIAASAMLGLMAAGTIVACRLRTRQLAEQRTASTER